MSDHPHRDIAMQAKAWPFEEARKVLAHVGGKKPEKGYVLFETGYGPSGLPHIGTFGEVVRTTMVRKAFEQISDIPTKLICFSDDMDGFRKVPTNLPQQEMLAEYLHKPLTEVPDPFGTHESLGHHNNARLRSFLDSFGFEYDFVSSTETYKSGRFDEALLKLLAHYDDVMKIMLPTLGAERQATYSPFLPVCSKTGHVLQVPVVETKLDSGTIVYRDHDGSLVETPVTGGHCKLQWKPDWAMRQYALDVDYEMSGKDLIDSVKQANRIQKAMGGKGPATFTYELFLDEKGEKISKSKGNGLSLEEWLTYAPQESLSLFMYNKPRAAKKLYFDVIPRMVDDYLTFRGKVAGQDEAQRFENPAWHIHSGAVPQEKGSVTFGLLLNLASVCNAQDKETLWNFIKRYDPEASAETAPFLDGLAGYAVRYYQDFVRPSLKYRLPTEQERPAFEELKGLLEKVDREISSDDLQTEIFTIGKNHGYENLREWFKCLYEVLLGQPQGPRMGTFFTLFGLEASLDLVNRVLAGADLSAQE
ncbi:lysine--tRNA ligase [Kiloniella sp. b19]|uniref:lysine--tRNA ligase n=1 Tax=Kiloniella sp. GXU_MW_B19 TaxID=3141326 RepID=UPI0031D87E06